MSDRWSGVGSIARGREPGRAFIRMPLDPPAATRRTVAATPFI